MSGAITAGIGDIFKGVGGTATDFGARVMHEVQRAGAHALAQGTFSVMRGGDFWQGAAAGALGSLFGEAGAAFGIHNQLALGLLGTAGGGLGSYLTGASSDEILLGLMSGAMVGLLNAGVQNAAKETQKNQLAKIGTILGLNAEGTKILLQITENSPKSLVKFAKVIAELSGYPSAIIAIGMAIDNPTSANIVSAISNSALVLAGPELAVLSGILDLTGYSDKGYNFIGTKIDNSINHTFDSFYNINQNLNNIFNPSNLFNP